MSTINKFQMLFVVAVVLEASGSPLFQGLSFQRGFEINFKPLPRKPIEFLKENWSPFGVFGKKVSLHKRSLDDMVPRPPEWVPRPAAPVFEHIEEIEHTGPLFILPKPVSKPVIPPPVSAAPKPPQPPPPPPPESSPKPPPPPLPAPMPIIVNELPPLPEKYPVIPPISTNMVVIEPTKIIKSHGPPKPGLYTDITRADLVKEHIHSIKPLPPPVEPKPPVPPVKPPVAEPIPKPPVALVPPSSVVPPAPPVAPPPQVVSVPSPPVVPVPPPPVPPIPPPGSPVLLPPIPPKAPIITPPAPIPIKEEKKEEPPVPIPPPRPKTEILLKDSSLIRGSKMALQFGTVFLTLMAQFFDNARATIDQMTNPPPIFRQ